MILLWPVDHPPKLPPWKRGSGGSDAFVARSYYWLELQDSAVWGAAEENTARRLLQCTKESPAAKQALADASEEVVGWVVPRSGLISAWSSKATDILRLAGLKAILRVERSTLLVRGNKKGGDEDPSDYYDAMIEVLVATQEQACEVMFGSLQQRTESSQHLSFSLTKRSLTAWNEHLSWQLSAQALLWLEEHYQRTHHHPTDVEIQMFIEVNSEHCRHGIFRSPWLLTTASGESRLCSSLFSLIQATTQKSPGGVLSAYHDNAAVLSGHVVDELCSDPISGLWQEQREMREVVLKVETHNHPTALSPYPGAATGVGGEIRDEVATGRGGRTVAGMCGYSVSHLRVPSHMMPWEGPYEHLPPHPFIASALRIMLEAPLGAADYGNEYGRPLITGFFRSLEYRSPTAAHVGEARKKAEFWRGYHKPLMICGGLGAIENKRVHKRKAAPGDLLITLGGAAMKIGLGGGSLSSQGGGSSAEQEFASVQRDNAEMQRRVFGALEAMWKAQSDAIVSIHDVGAGGWANALPELVHESGRGARILLRSLPLADASMTPREIWCNESQERYVLCLAQEHLALWKMLCDRERAPYAVVGEVQQEESLILYDEEHQSHPVDMPLETLLGFREGQREVTEVLEVTDCVENFYEGIDFKSIIWRLFQRPEVGDKSFLITIADRSVGGLTYRDPMVGPWQVPVADGGVMFAGFRGSEGQIMAVGERSVVALKNAAAASRLAAAEAVMNALSADIHALSDIKFSANWQVDFSHTPDQAGLRRAVEALNAWCLELGIAVPVGKDSMSMKVEWQDSQGDEKPEKPISYRVSSPISLVITAVASVPDVRKSLSPQWQNRRSHLLWLHLGGDHFRTGCTSFSLAFDSLGGEVPDVSAEVMQRFFEGMLKIRSHGMLLAYHDISDGGMITCLAEMAFASGRGISISLDELCCSSYQALFSEEIGALVQVDWDAKEYVQEVFAAAQIPCYHLGSLQPWHPEHPSRSLEVKRDNRVLFSYDVFELKDLWSRLHYQMRKLRDGEKVAEQERKWNTDPANSGLFCEVPENYADFISVSAQDAPRVAILREQGVNGHREMAFAFHHAGFEAVDVTMSDLLEARVDLDSFQGFVACGGFSFGDVLGAGAGWAGVIREHEILRSSFQRFLHNPQRFALGVCNGAQMLTHLRHWIPGGEHWPQLLPNSSGRFESRLVMVEVCRSPSIFWRDMAGWKLPVIVAHAEGRAALSKKDQPPLVGMRYIDCNGHPTQLYPANPAGSEHAVAAVTSEDGRVSVMMPHPERCYRSAHDSWMPSPSSPSPWKAMFCSARVFAQQQKR